MRLSIAKWCSWKAGKIETDFEKMKWHVKMHEKNAARIEKKRNDIFPPLGVALCTLALPNAALGRQAQSKGKQKFGFINGVDNVNWPPYRDSKS